jgi:hypothetical protein
MENNVAFYIYKETIRDNIQRTLHIPPQVADAYKVAAHFKAECHHMYIHAKKGPNQQWLPTQYRLTEEDMGHIMVNWDDEWNIPPTNIRASEKQNPKIHEGDEDE